MARLGKGVVRKGKSFRREFQSECPVHRCIIVVALSVEKMIHSVH